MEAAVAEHNYCSSARFEAKRVDWFTDMAKAAEESPDTAFSDALLRPKGVDDQFGDNYGAVAAEVEAVVVNCLLDALSCGGGPKEVAGRWTLTRKS